MSDAIDDVILGILERAKQRKELLTNMVSKKSDSCLPNEIENAEETINVSVNLNKAIIDSPTKVMTHDLSQPEPIGTPTTFDCESPAEIQQIASSSAKFSSLTIALNAEPKTENVIGGCFIRSQKKTPNPINKISSVVTDNIKSCEVNSEPIKPCIPECIDSENATAIVETKSPSVDFSRSGSPGRQRGRLALASLASKYSQLDSFEITNANHNVKKDSAVEGKGIFGLSNLVSKDSELVKKYTNFDDDDWNYKPPKNITTKTKVSNKRWTAPTVPSTTPVTFAVSSKPAVTTNVKPNAKSTDFISNIQLVTPPKISVAKTAKMFESPAASTAATTTSFPVTQITATSSTAKARAAFFNSLSAGSSHAPLPNPQRVVASKRSVALFCTTSPIVSTTSPKTFVTQPQDVTTTQELNMTSKPSAPSSLGFTKQLASLKEEEISPEVIPRSKTSRRDSWEDSKASMDAEDDDNNDDVEVNKPGHGLIQLTNQDEDENNDADINDEDFGDDSGHSDFTQNNKDDVLKECCENDDDDSEDEFIFSKPQKEFQIMKDITNLTSPSKNNDFENINVKTTSSSHRQGDLKEDGQHSATSTPSKNDQQMEVTMRKTKRRSGSLEKPRGYISVYEYRKIKQSRPKSQPPPPKPRRTKNDENIPEEISMNNNTSSPQTGVIMRNKKLYPDLSTDLVTSPTSSKTVHQRLQELDHLINQEVNVIYQTSNALNKCCHELSLFSESPQAVECHKHLLMACKKREAYMIEAGKLKALKLPNSPHQLRDGGPIGRLTISEIRMPMKAEFMAKLNTSEDTTIHYFLLAIRHNNFLHFSQMISTHESQLNNKHHRKCDYLEFPNLISLNNIEQDFQISVEVYGMSITKSHNEPGTPRKTPRKALLTPRSSRRFESPAGPMSVRSTNFVHLATAHLDKNKITADMFTLDKVPISYPLQSCLFMNIKFIMENVVQKKDFLTMFEDVSGFGAWHRRWFFLRQGKLLYWKYPEDESHKESMGVIDLKTCITPHVGLVSRDVCARPHTFQIETTQKQRRGDRNTLVQTCDDRGASLTTRYWLSADTAEDRESWCRSLNESLMNVRAWHPDAIRPNSHR